MNKLRFALVILFCLAVSPAVLAHSPLVDSSLRDWCVGATSKRFPNRVEDSATRLTCGNCSLAPGQACLVDSDCPPTGGSCVNRTSKTEVAFWDNRTDGAVNDLATVAMTYDNTNLYIAAELWVDPDPVSLPFGEIAIDYTSGGLGTWHDPNEVLVTPGHCSVFTDRACTSDADCHFCTISQEPTGGRVRTCGSACDPGIGDVCRTNQVCVGLGEGGLRNRLAFDSSPEALADYLLVFDFSLWVVGAGDAAMLMQPGTTIDPTSPWDPVRGCQPDPGETDTTCDFPPAVNPGQSGGSGGPPGSVELAVPWSAFGCTGCPTACNCPGFGPGDPFRFTMTVARGALALALGGFDFKPDGAHEDVISEPVGGVTTTSTNNCPGFGIGTTACELDDRSLDGFFPKQPPLQHELVPGGHVNGLKLSKNAGSSITLDWNPSCSANDTDYEVYTGSVGTWYSHVPVPGLCMTGGTTATFDAPPGDFYYLIVPTNGPTEGSYGRDGARAERPPSADACVVQSLGSCP